MRSRLLLVSALCLVGLMTRSAENEPPQAGKSNSEIEIKAESAEFDLAGRVAVYRGKVEVTDPQLRLICDTLTARWSITNTLLGVIAEGSVRLDMTVAQGASSATADKAVYDAVTNVVELTGNPKLTNPQGTLTGDRVLLDRASGRLRAAGNVRMLMSMETVKPKGPKP